MGSDSGPVRTPEMDMLFVKIQGKKQIPRAPFWKRREQTYAPGPLGMTTVRPCQHPPRSRPTILFALTVALLMSLVAGRSAAQESQLDKGPTPPYVEPAPPPVPAEPTYDPLRAGKSMEIGTFYLKRGNYDAAIERFQDATHYQPKLAKPYALMGEAYERKGDVEKALASYRKYLQVYRTAPDREKIQKRIEKLESQMGHAQGKSG
jgi:tetratricopeptide (TPR) repeat protein